MPTTRNPKGSRTPSRTIPHRPRGARNQRVHSSVTDDENRKVLKVAREWYGVDVSVLLYFKSIKEILRLHELVFPKGKAPAVSD